MKKICILAYWYPPIQSVGGLRTESFHKYSEENDFNSFVVTIEPNKLCTPSTPFIDEQEGIYRISGFDSNFLIRNVLKKVLGRSNEKHEDQYKVRLKSDSIFIQKFKSIFYNIYRKIFCFPDTHFLWFLKGKKQLREIIEKEKPDYILTTAYPVMSFYFGKYIKKKYPNIKWIADYRDLWSQHQWYERPWPLNKFENWVEKKTLLPADLIITTSIEFQTKLFGLHKNRATVPIIYNGFDEEVNKQVHTIDKFTVSYTGVLYDQQRPDLLFEAVKSLVESKKIDQNKFQIDFYGKMPSYLDSEIMKFGLSGIVKIHGLIPREEVLDKQRSSNVLLLIRWDEGPLHVKVFEYLSARIPILGMVKKDSEIYDLINQTDAGLATSSKEEIEMFILEEYNKWIKSGQNRLVDFSCKINDFSRKKQAGNLYDKLKSL